MANVKSLPSAETMHPASAVRRKVLSYGVASAAAMLSPCWAHAQQYPTRPIKNIISFPAGGGTDILSRVVGKRLGALLGQSIVVENRPGGGQMIGLNAAARAAPDGYTIHFSSMTNQIISSCLYKKNKTNSDLIRDFEPVALIATTPHVLNVNTAVPASNMQEFVAWLKSKNGQVEYASQGAGTLSHLEAVLLAQKLGLKLIHIPYKGSSNALPDLLAGRVSFMFDSVAASIAFIKNGKLRPLAVASTARVPMLPNVPTVAEAGIVGYDVDNYMGLFVPKGTPHNVVNKLESAVLKVMAEPSMSSTLSDLGFVAKPGPASELAELTADELRRWSAVIEAAKISIS